MPFTGETPSDIRLKVTKRPIEIGIWHDSDWSPEIL